MQYAWMYMCVTEYLYTAMVPVLESGKQFVLFALKAEHGDAVLMATSTVRTVFRMKCSTFHLKSSMAGTSRNFEVLQQCHADHKIISVVRESCPTSAD